MNKATLLKLLKELGIKPSSRFGQNFLLDKNLLYFIVSLIEPKESEKIIEIGPGLGALTRELIKKKSKVIGIEIDKRLSEYLKENIDDKYFSLIIADACKIDYDLLVKKDENYKIVGNLPYSITTPIIDRIIKMRYPPKRGIFLVQKECAQRLAAKPNSKDYGSISVKVQAKFDISIIRMVPPEVFFPRPKVISSIIELKRKEQFNALDIEKLDHLTKLLFQQRRKKAIKLLSKIYGKEIAEYLFKKNNIEFDVRAENIDVKTYIALASQLL